jgi:uncharacterized protein (TIGR03382 family)
MKVPGPSMATIGAMFLRSLLMLPFALFLGIAYLSCVILPLSAVSFVLDSQWLWAAGTAATWVVSLTIVFWWLRRRRVPEKPVRDVMI